MVASVVLDLASDVFAGHDMIEDMTYTPATGSPSSARVAVSRGIQRVGYDSRLAESHDEATFLKSIITAPKRGETISDGTDTFTLVSAIFDDAVTSTWLVSG